MDVNPTFFYLANGNNATSRLNIRSAKAPVDNIVNNQKAIFTNATKWDSGTLILNNPEIAVAQIQGIPKEIKQQNSQINIASYLQENFNVVNSNVTINGNTVEYRITGLTLPNISRNTATKIFNGLPDNLIPENNKITNTITSNGVIVALSTNTNGSFTITPLSSSITSGDTLYFTHIYIK